MDKNNVMSPDYVPEEYSVPYDILELPSQGLLYKNKSKYFTRDICIWRLNTRV